MEVLLNEVDEITEDGDALVSLKKIVDKELDDIECYLNPTHGLEVKCLRFKDGTSVLFEASGDIVYLEADAETIPELDTDILDDLWEQELKIARQAEEREAEELEEQHYDDEGIVAYRRSQDDEQED